MAAPSSAGSRALTRISTWRRSRWTPATRRRSRGTPSGRGRGGAPGGRGGVGRGEPVIALANPGGRGLRATFGQVSATGRSFRGPRGRRIGGSLEHTAPLPRGSSGGPLVDGEHRLLGLNSIRLEGGLILALPAAAAMQRRAGAASAGGAGATARR